MVFSGLVCEWGIVALQEIWRWVALSHSRSQIHVINFTIQKPNITNVINHGATEKVWPISSSYMYKINFATQKLKIIKVFLCHPSHTCIKWYLTLPTCEWPTWCLIKAPAHCTVLHMSLGVVITYGLLMADGWWLPARRWSGWWPPITNHCPPLLTDRPAKPSPERGAVRVVKGNHSLLLALACTTFHLLNTSEVPSVSGAKVVMGC